MPPEEHVMVVERRVVEQLGLFNGLAFDIDRYLEAIFQQGVPRFLPRGQVEQDPSYKQLIPYVIMTCGGSVLSYVRGKRAGETRLLGNRSIGIGGHINPIDDMALLGVRETYNEAVDREVKEEVAVDSPHTDRILALLNDDSNEVGRVHLGVVHLWRLEQPRVEKREQMITQLGFMTLAELERERDSLETWSALCLDHLLTLEQQGHSF